MSRSLGRNVPRLDLELFRDSAFVDFVERDPLTSATIFFPTLDSGVAWEATVTQDGDVGRAVWSVESALTNAIPDRDDTGALTPWELWVDGVAVAAGFVVRRGGDVTLPSPDGNGGPVSLLFPGPNVYPSANLYPIGPAT